MRTLLKAQFPVEAANAAIKDGTLGKTMEQVLGAIKPESAYFLAENGLRTAIAVFDLKDPSDIPVIAEPLFMNLNASVTFTPCMNRDELQAGLGKALGG